MKSKLLVLLSLCFTYTVSAQLVISPGAQLFVAGNTQITLLNTDLVNNGSFTPGNDITRFTGNATSSISGTQAIQFNELEINKGLNNSVTLQRAIGVTQRILFTSGFLNLNGFNTDLGTTGHLDGEQENSRITGANGGQVLFSTVLNAPNGANPASLGAVITSSKDLGNVIIKRGHQSQTNGSGLGISILRYYDITPVNDSGLNATLRINYFDGELNGLNENVLDVFKSNNTINWADLGFTTRNNINNFVEKIGINSLSRWTLSSAGNPLPVLFISFNAKCEGNKIIINWKTAQEQNSDRFDIEKSTDGIHWRVIGSLPAAGNSSTEKSYSFTDNNPVQNNYYRIAEYDLGGRVQFTGILRSSCGAADAFVLWPNPVHDDLYINIVATAKSQAEIRLFDSKGALVKMLKETVLPGSNQFRINMAFLPNGTYLLAAEWNNGQVKRTVSVIKR